MPKCLECGKVLPRLQWTHFRYKCTNKFKNGTEYLKVYPDAILVDPEIAAKTAITLENLITKYGDEEGRQRWETYKQKQADSNTFEYKASKHGWSKKEFDAFNQSRAVTLDNLVKKHGEVEGLEKWDEYCERQRYTNSLDYFQEKYGNSDGLSRWNTYCVERSKAQDINHIMEKYKVDELGAEAILAERYASSAKYTSIAEQQFINDVINLVGNIKYTYQTKQFCIWSDDLQTPLFFDATCSTKMKMIEFNGDYWHCNPVQYESEYVHSHSGKTAKEIWHRDSKKIEVARSRGFDVLVVWESEYNHHKHEILQQIKQWWNNERTNS